MNGAFHRYGFNVADNSDSTSSFALCQSYARLRDLEGIVSKPANIALAVSFGAREATTNWLVDLAGSVGMVHRRNQDGIDPARFEA